MTPYLNHARFLAAGLAVVVGLTFVAPPAFAAEAAIPAQPLTAAAAAKVGAIPASALAQATAPAQPAAAEASKPFLKTGKGAAAVTLIVAALAMTFVSFGKDRVQSPKNAAK